MRIADVKQIVLTELTPFAEEHGLKIKKGDFGLFSKKGQNPSIEIFFLYNTWGFEVQLFPIVWLKYKEIHDICEDCGFDLNYTVGINLLLLEEIYKHGWSIDLKWKVELENRERIPLVDGEEWIDKLRKTMKRLCPLAIDYINRYSTIEAVDRLYNQFPIDEDNPNCCFMISHCFIGLIAAKLSNNPDYDSLKKVYTLYVKTEKCMRDEDRIAFFRLVKYLDNMPS